MWRAMISAALGLSVGVQAAAGCAVDAMVVFDASASMNSQDFDANTTRRIDEARTALADVMPRVEHIRRIGLITYGSGGGDCDGISLRFAPIPDAAARLSAEVGAVRPGGLTPLTEAVHRAARALAPGPGIVVLVTDGNESCGGAPCALAHTLPEALEVHVITFKIVWNAFASHDAHRTETSGPDVAMRCLADRTGGQVVSTDSVEGLVAALEATLGCPIVGRTEPKGALRVLPS